MATHLPLRPSRAPPSLQAGAAKTEHILVRCIVRLRNGTQVTWLRGNGTRTDRRGGFDGERQREREKGREETTQGSQPNAETGLDLWPQKGKRLAFEEPERDSAVGPLGGLRHEAVGVRGSQWCHGGSRSKRATCGVGS